MERNWSGRLRLDVTLTPSIKIRGKNSIVKASILPRRVNAVFSAALTYYCRSDVCFLLYAALVQYWGNDVCLLCAASALYCLQQDVEEKAQYTQIRIWT